MIFALEVSDADLEYVRKNQRHGSFTLNRWSNEDSAKCSRLRSLGVIANVPYYGEAMCYNPTYKLTELGKSVFKQYEDQSPTKE